MQTLHFERYQNSIDIIPHGFRFSTIESKLFLIYNYLIMLSVYIARCMSY